MKSRSYLDRLLGHLVNNVTVELALVVSTVIWPNMPSSNSGQRSTSADARGRGTAAYGEGSSTSFEAWDKAFTILARRYPRLEVLRIIITDLRVFAVEDEVSTINVTVKERYPYRTAPVPTVPARFRHVVFLFSRHAIRSGSEAKAGRARSMLSLNG